MQEVFYLKYRDTKPKLIVTLINPDETLHDLTGITNVKLHIKLNGGTVLTRPMTIEGSPAAAQVGYLWVATDWDAGGLVLGVHDMECESVDERLTFPNDRHLKLKVFQDLGQG